MLIEADARFARQSGELERVFRFVGEFCERAALDDANRYLVEFTTEELFTNMVRHNADGQGDVGIGIRLAAGELSMRFTDYDTPRFDITRDAPEVDINLPLEQRTPGGLGIHLVKTMMDRIEYVHSGRTGTISLYKRVQSC